MRTGNNQYHIQEEARTALQRAGSLMTGLAQLSEKIMLPNPGPEMTAFIAGAFYAMTTGEPLALYTPVCPDWSRDSLGIYEHSTD